MICRKKVKKKFYDYFEKISTEESDNPFHISAQLWSYPAITIDKTIAFLKWI